MKCPNCRTNLTTLIVYEKTYHKCGECGTYFTPELKEIDDILEYKNKIRRKALREYLKVDDKNKEQKQKQEEASEG